MEEEAEEDESLKDLTAALKGCKEGVSEEEETGEGASRFEDGALPDEAVVDDPLFLVGVDDSFFSDDEEGGGCGFLGESNNEATETAAAAAAAAELEVVVEAVEVDGAAAASAS